MRLLDSILSRSSANGSSASSDVARSWTLVSSSKSNTPHPPGQKGLMREATPEILHPAKGGCAIGEECDRVSAGEVPDDKQKQPVLEGPVSGVDSGAGNGPAPEPGLPSTIHRSSIRGSRRLTGLKSLFRSRKFERQKLGFDGPRGTGKEDICDTVGSADPIVVKRSGSVAFEDEEEASLQPVPEPETYTRNECEVRKVSNKTDGSLNSTTTSMTIYRCPSKRLSMPILLANEPCDDQNPFDDIWEVSHSESTVSNPFTGHSKSTSESTGPSGSSYSGPSNPPSSYSGHVLELSGSSQSSWCLPNLSRPDAWPTPSDRRLAALSFNRLATELYLEPLTIRSDDINDKGPATRVMEPSVVDAERLARRRDRLFGRIRTMRSSLHIKSEPLAHTRKLRRMRTFASLISRPCLMASLKGKSLENLARLGGYGFLTLPGDFSPATLTLPVCFVAVANYLRCFAPGVQNLFVDGGNLETATQTYEHFASQVLCAEKERDKIQLTMRSSKMPSFLEEDPGFDTETRESGQVLAIAMVFKALLAGLPGGILGSMQLHRTLVNIFYGRTLKVPSKPINSRLGGLSPQSYAKVRAVSLAIVALTNSMQLNLICAVFGLCALLLHETERVYRVQKQKSRGSVRNASGTIMGRLSVDRLTEVFGPLLTEGGQEESMDMFHAIQREIENQRIASLLIENWRSVSRQLRLWEHRGLEARMRGGSWSRTASDSSTQET